MSVNNSFARVESCASLADLPEAARAAMAEVETTDVEQGEAWLQNLISGVFPGNSDVRFFTLYEGENVRALLPLRYDADRKEVCALGNFYTSLYRPFVAPGVSPATLALLFKDVVATWPHLRAVRLSPMSVDEASFIALKAALRCAGLFSFPYFCFGNWYLPLHSETWKDYLETRSGQVRSTLKRKTKEFAQAGGSLEVIRNGERLDDGIAAYQAVYAESWKVPEPYPAFVPGLIRVLADKGWLRLGVAWLNGKPIAAQIWMVANGRAAIFKLAYHEEFKRYSAGTLLTAMLMESALDGDRVGEVDYLIGDDPYKASWMTKRRERWGLIAYNPRSLSGLWGAIRELSGRIIKAILKKRRPTHDAGKVGA